MNKLTSVFLALVIYAIVMTNSVAVMAQSDRGSTAVLFATHRNIAVRGQQIQLGPQSSPTVAFGQASVNEQKEGDPRSATLRNTALLTTDQFRQAIKDAAARAKNYERRALIVIHGFNKTFNQAVIQVASLASSIKFDGPIILYSWPSGGATYGLERQNAIEAETNLLALLTLVVEEVRSEKVSLVAYGLGSEPLLRATERLIVSLPSGSQLGQMLFFAPDVERDVFTR